MADTQKKPKGFDDGLYAACRFCEFFSYEEKKLSDLFQEFEACYQTDILSICTKKASKFIMIEHVKSVFIQEKIPFFEMDGLRYEQKDGWGLVRASYTEEKLTFRFESKTLTGIKRIQHLFLDIFTKTATYFSWPINDFSIILSSPNMSYPYQNSLVMNDDKK